MVANMSKRAANDKMNCKNMCDENIKKCKHKRSAAKTKNAAFNKNTSKNLQSIKKKCNNHNNVVQAKTKSCNHREKMMQMVKTFEYSLNHYINSTTIGR